MSQTKTKVICFANNKGGSGKSTTCANVGYSMVTEGKKVLLIDGDMQMNLTLSYFDEEAALGFNESGENLYTAIKQQKELTPFIRHTAYEGLDLIPSSILMSGIEVDLFTMWQREFILKQGLAKIRESGEYDYILHGTEGKQWMKRTDKGSIADPDSTAVEVVNGNDIRTTLDIDIQDIADRALRKNIGDDAEILDGFLGDKAESFNTEQTETARTDKNAGDQICRDSGKLDFFCQTGHQKATDHCDSQTDQKLFHIKVTPLFFNSGHNYITRNTIFNVNNQQ